jgi:hypothetical protein
MVYCFSHVINGEKSNLDCEKIKQLKPKPIGLKVGTIGGSVRLEKEKLKNHSRPN